MADTNTYTQGQCTWWAKNQAPWWPSGAGNAAEWWGYAQQRGYKTSQNPQVGALAVWGPGVDPPLGFGHVAVVKAVRPDGSFNVSEMNWKGVGVIDNRDVGDRTNLLGFILPPGAQATSDDTGGVGGAIQQAGSQLLGAGQVAGGGLLVIAGLVIAVLLVAKPGPLRALR